MKFSELKVGDCFYFHIEKANTKPVFEKTEHITTFPDINNDIYEWNCKSLRDSSHFIYCEPDEEVYPFDRDGFY